MLVLSLFSAAQAPSSSMGLEPGSHGSYGKSLGMNLMSNPGNGGAASAFNQDEGDPAPYFDTSAYITSSEPRMGTQEDWLKAAALTGLNNANLAKKHYDKFSAGEGDAEEVSTEFVNEGLDTGFRTGGTLTGDVAKNFQQITGTIQQSAQAVEGTAGGGGGGEMPDGEMPMEKQAAAPAPTWQDFMNTGIQTGMGFAMAGSQTASDYGSGKGDNKATQDTYMQLSQGAGNKFMTMGSAASSQGQKLRQAAAGAKRPSTVPPAAVMGLAALGLAAAALAIGRRNKAAEVSTAAAPSPMPMV